MIWLFLFCWAKNIHIYTCIFSLAKQNFLLYLEIIVSEYFYFGDTGNIFRKRTNFGFAIIFKSTENVYLTKKMLCQLL